MNTIFSLPMDIYKNRRLVAKLAKNDFKTRYAGNDTMLIYLFRVTFVAIYTCTIHPFVRHFNRLNFINAYFSTN